MKLFGSIKELVSAVFRKDSQEITVRPNQSTTYTAARDIQLPAGDTAHVIVSRTSSDTLTNKTIDGDDNTIQDLALSSLKTVLGDANEALVRDGSGAVISALIVNANIDAAAAIAATKIADGSVDNTEFQRLGTAGTAGAGNLVTTDGTQTLTGKTISGSSNTLTVLAGTQLSGQVPIANGGTGQSSQTAAFDALAPSTTKGDLIVHDGTDNVRLPVGTNTFVLSADSAEPTGLKWVATSSSTATPTTQGVVTSFFPVVANSVNTVGDADYTITATDGYELITAAPSAASRTITLPATSVSTGRRIVIKRLDTNGATRDLIIAWNASDAGIDNVTSNNQYILTAQYSYVVLYCDGTTTWKVLGAWDYVATTQSLTNYPTSGQYGDLTSVTVGAGEWELSCNLYYVAAGGTSSGDMQYGISSTSGNSATGLINGENYGRENISTILSAGAILQRSITSWRVSPTSKTTYYFKYLSSWGTAVPQAAGRLIARRMK